MDMTTMKNIRILLTAFRGTSAELLIKDCAEYKTLILPNDKGKDSEKLINALSKEHFDSIISFGQRPNIKDKVHIETMAKEGEIHLETAFDCERLKMLFEQNGIDARLSHNAGTSFCNRLYWSGLKYISDYEQDTKMVFVHIPFGKNISEFEMFKERIIKTIDIFM